jgi:hypothetical protein
VHFVSSRAEPARSARIASANSARDVRVRIVQAQDEAVLPPRACSQLASATCVPTWSRLVGLGAKRTRRHRSVRSSRARTEAVGSDSAGRAEGAAVILTPGGACRLVFRRQHRQTRMTVSALAARHDIPIAAVFDQASRISSSWS